MKLLVFSDTHSHVAHMRQVLQREQKDSAACFFLGDGLAEVEQMQQDFPALPFYMVQGNCDLGSYEPYEGLAPFGGVLFFYTHGHQLHVKSDLETLWWRARQRQADVALFGHTHVPYHENQGGIDLFNPGSIAVPRFGPPTYGRITIENAVPAFEIVKFAE